MRAGRLLAAMVMVAAAAGGCSSSDEGEGTASDELVAEMQAEINRLKAELDLATTGTTAVTVPSDTTVPDSSPSAVDLMPFYDEVLVGLAAQTEELASRASQANAAWENEAATYEATHDVFTDVMIQARGLAVAAQALPIPAELELRYADAIDGFEELANAAEALVGGLEAPDDGTLRRAAADRVARWVVTLQDQILFDG